MEDAASRKYALIYCTVICATLAGLAVALWLLFFRGVRYVGPVPTLAFFGLPPLVLPWAAPPSQLSRRGRAYTRVLSVIVVMCVVVLIFVRDG